MVNIVLGCDRNGNDQEYQSTVAQVLEQAGHTVEKLEIEPNAFASYSYDSSKAKGKVGIYLIAAGTYSIGDATYGGTFFDYNYFGIRPEVSPSWDVNDWDTKPIGSDPDTRGGVTDKIAGHTFAEINEIVKERSMCVTGKNASEMGKNLVDAIAGKGFQPGGTPTTETTSGGSAVLIPDKTFYGLIKQMIGAIDGVFIIANNMAYLLSFQQFFSYRDQYEDYILELKPSEIITDSIVRNWTTDGLYNTVEVTYAEGIIKLQHDALVEVYGESVFHYNFPEDDAETAKAKADALLSAHVRDYSLDLQLNCIYNPNITVGSWIKIPKTLTKVSGPTSKTGGEMLAAKKNEPKKFKGANITNLNEILQKIDDKTKTVQKITTDNGKKYEVEVEKKNYEIFFVQAYKLRWTPKQAPIMSLHLKYGPDTPEDPINATVGTGGIQSTTTTGGGGGYGDDCFWVGEIMPNNNAYINDSHYLAEGDLHKPGFEPQEQHYKPRCKKGSNLDKDMQGKTPQEVHNAVRAKFGYCKYAESSELWPCVSDMYDQACGTNCGDGARILKCALDAIGVKSWGVHINGHYFCAAELEGKWVALDATGYYEYSNTAGWPAGPKPDNCCEPGQADKVRMF